MKDWKKKHGRSYLRVCRHVIIVKLTLCVRVCVCLSMYAHTFTRLCTCVSWHACGDQKTTSWSQFAPSTMWALGTELKWLHLIELSHWSRLVFLLYYADEIQSIFLKTRWDFNPFYIISSKLLIPLQEALLSKRWIENREWKLTAFWCHLSRAIGRTWINY